MSHDDDDIYYAPWADAKDPEVIDRWLEGPDD